MRARPMIAISVLALLANGCGPSINVDTDWDPQADFSGIETFTVMDEAQGGGGLTSFQQSRIKSAIVTTMEAKGLRQVSNNADVAVGFQAVMDQRSSFQTVNTGWSSHGWRGGWGGSSMGMSTSRTTETRYDVGTLVIAMANSDNNLIFQSTGSKTLESGMGPDEAQGVMDDAVARILRDFPPGS